MPPTVVRVRALAAAAAAATALAGLSLPAPSAQATDACPTGFVGVPAATAETRLADRNGDGRICSVVIDRRDGNPTTQVTVLTDNESGGVGTDWVSVPCHIGLKLAEPLNRPLDGVWLDNYVDVLDHNGDLRVCVAVLNAASQHTVVVLDNARPATITATATPTVLPTASAR